MISRIAMRRNFGAVMASYLLIAGSPSQPAVAQTWESAFGNSSNRASRAGVIGPNYPNLLWQGSLTSFTAGAPVIGDGRVFLARMVNPNDVTAGSVIVAHDLATGQIAWSTPLPVLPGEACVTSSATTTCDRSRVFAFHNHRVYASRGGIQGDPLYGLDPATGAVIWTSDEDVQMEDSFSPVFAPDGDPIVLVRCCIEGDSLLLISPRLIDVQPITEGPGGGLGGNSYTFAATLALGIQGTIQLSGFTRTVLIPVQVELWTAPFTPGDAVQVITAEIASISGALGDDPDFCNINFSAGTLFGHFSPGTITLVRTGGPGSDFMVDSLFDVRSEIQYEACPESVLAGLSGSQSARFDWLQSCVKPDDGNGSVDIPIDCPLTILPADAIEIEVIEGDACMATAPTFGGAAASAYCLGIPDSGDGRGPFIRRIDSVTGETVWTSKRLSMLTSPASNMAIANGSIYVWESQASSLGITAIDLETGLDKYSFAIPNLDLSCVHPNWQNFFAAQQTGVFTGPDGTIYAPRQLQCLIALTDTGSALEEKWRTEMGGEAFSTFAIGLDGTVYVTAPRGAGQSMVDLKRLNPDNGATLNVTSVPIEQGGSIRLACDAAGKIYVNNAGIGATGRVYCYGPDLTFIWSDVVGDMGFFGGPVIGGDGVLVVAASQMVVRAYRDLYGDLDCSGTVTLSDLEPFVVAMVDPESYAAAFSLCNSLSADMNRDGLVNGIDIRPFVMALLGQSPGGTIQYSTQDRYIFAESEAPDDFDSTGVVSASGFAPFNESRTATADDGDNVVVSTVSQNSTLGAASIDASGSVNGTITGPDGGTCFSDNSFNVTFVLTAPTNASLSGSVSSANVDTNASFSLVGPGGNIVNTGNVTNSTQPFSFNGPLAAGQYTMQASTSYEFNSGAGQGAYSVDFDLLP